NSYITPSPSRVLPTMHHAFLSPFPSLALALQRGPNVDCTFPSHSLAHPSTHTDTHIPCPNTDSLPPTLAPFPSRVLPTLSKSCSLLVPHTHPSLASPSPSLTLLQRGPNVGQAPFLPNPLTSRAYTPPPLTLDLVWPSPQRDNHPEPLLPQCDHD
ncbi:hypothetical protein PIB30_079769, partial [Stylosanthes scabra]|nr:hypothetical protein [Stylosanthes scabra]